MAYRRPLSPSQIFCIILLWLIIVVYIVLYAQLTGPTILTLFLASFIVWYPVIKSIRQRRQGRR